FLKKEIFYVFEFCCVRAVCNNLGPRSIYVDCAAKVSRSVREPGIAYEINLPTICHCFERRKDDACFRGVRADSKCVINAVRGTKRLYFHWKTVTAKSEYCRYFWSYRFFSALRKHPFCHF